MQLILASTSAWRRKLLKDAGLACIVFDSGVDESAILDDDPIEMAVKRARAKADAVREQHRTGIVLGADQVVHWSGEVFGKPHSPEVWLRQLKRLRGKKHRLTTAVVLLHPDGRSETLRVHSGVVFRSDTTDVELQSYVQYGEAGGCAGGYMVERRGAWLIERVEGDWQNVIGLPILEIIGVLRRWGWRFSDSGSNVEIPTE